MTRRRNPRILIGGAALGLFLSMSLAPAAAQAGHGWWRRPAPGPFCCYEPAVLEAVLDAVQLGFSVAGVVQSPPIGGLPLGGIAAALRIQPSSQSLLALEIQSLGAEQGPDGPRRHELAGLVVGRVYLWNAPLAPYLELAGGLGRASVEMNAFEVRASQLVGRIGIGLELRLGQHLALEGEIAQVHRLRLGDDPSYDSDPCCAALLDHHERATELRGGLAFRF
jgi:hypothetical protein